MKEKIKKVENFISKHDELFFILVILTMISGFALNVKTLVGDEIWNFQNVYKIYSGYKIYADANVITTPMFHIIGAVFFKLFGANFFIFRIYNILINLFLFFGVYKIFKALNINKRKCWLLSLLIFAVEYETITSMASYNILAITFCLYGILIILNREKIKNYVIYEAIFVTLVILTKQNIGVYYSIALIIYTFLNKKEIKNTLKILFLTGAFLIIFILILYFNNILKDFISYAVLGLGEFSQENRSIDTIQFICMIIFSLINSLLLLFFIFNDKYKNKEQYEELKILSCFSFSLLLTAYPIFNSLHIMYGIFVEYIMFFYMINNICEKFKIKKVIIDIVIFVIILIFSIYSVYNIKQYIKFIIKEEYEYSNIYFGAILEDNYKEKIKNVTEFIKKSDKKVIDISPDAAIYMLPIKQNNRVFDLLLLGNLGKDGENGIIYKLKQLQNTVVLVNNEGFSYQESDKIINFVKDNFKYIGKIEDLLIYETE